MRTIVISDLHLKIEDFKPKEEGIYPLLVSFIKKIYTENLADELVINGDFLDQWYVYGDKYPVDSDTFYKKVAENNKEVIDELKNLMGAGVKLVFIPGNHDMTLTKDTLDEILPGIVQICDAPGLGRYRTGERGEVLIEHSHRYELFSAPDTLSNKGLILPPGYFFSKIGHIKLNTKELSSKKSFNEIPIPSKNNKDKYNAYLYYKIWEDVIRDMFAYGDGYDNISFNVSVDEFSADFHLSDLLPELKDGKIQARLFKDICKNWGRNQERNLVNSPIDLTHHLKNIISQEERIIQAKRQYFDLDSSIDIVIFGHSHIPVYRKYSEYSKPKVFINCGSWLDTSYEDIDNTGTFVLINSNKKNTDTKLLKCIGKYKVERFSKVKNKYIKY